MQQKQNKTFARFIQFIPIWIGLSIGRMLPFNMRNGFFANVGGFLIPLIPGSRRRIYDGLNRVFPEMPDQEKKRLCKKIGKNSGRTLSEILFNRTYKHRLDLFDAKGDGLAVLKDAKANGKGAIIVSAHFGQWEAIRHYLMSQGMETGAVYRENNNPWYERYFLKGIKQGGEPVVAKSTGGNMKMIKHLRKGGFFALLVDQKYHLGYLLPFLGVDAMTTMSPAELALRYDLPLVPAFGTRDDNGHNIHIDFEKPVKHTDAVTMSREINDRISARILEHPEQWYWLHKRWDDTHMFEITHGEKGKKNRHLP